MSRTIKQTPLMGRTSSRGSVATRDTSLRNLHQSLQNESPIPMHGKENNTNHWTPHLSKGKKSTPMSILKSEMRGSETIEEDLLFSPPLRPRTISLIQPTKLKSPPERIVVQQTSQAGIATIETKSVSNQQTHYHSQNQEDSAVLSPILTGTSGRSTSSMLKPTKLSSPPERVPVATVVAQEPELQEKSIFSNTPVVEKASMKGERQPNISNTRAPLSARSKKDMTTKSFRQKLPPRAKTTPSTATKLHPQPANISTARIPPKATPVTQRLSVKTSDSVVKPWSHARATTKATPNVSNKPVDSVVSKQWSTSVFRPAATATPTTSAGVCMDLSQIFFDASKTKTVAKSPRTTRKPPRQSVSDPESDEWAEKQIQTFTEWLNYLFYPNADDEHDSALKQLKVFQQLAKDRLQASNLYQSTELSSIRQVLATEISKGKIALRDDQNLSSNLHQRRSILQLFFSYSENYLRLAIETIFGAILPYNNSKALKTFIVKHVLSDEKTLLKYTHGKCKIPSGKFENQYLEEIRTLVVYRILVIFVFLDRAKSSNILNDSLFKTNSQFKSTKQVLLGFCRDFLKAEGNFIKHLSRVGLNVHFEQSSIDELDFRVSNLSVDLNDGVRLARMTELLTDFNLLSMLRLPAVSRLQKFHNVKLTLDVLKDVVPECIAAHHIVDGHREMVLKLLWSVIAHYCLQALISVPMVEKEIKRIQEFHRLDATEKQFDELRDIIIEWCNVIVGGVLRKRQVDDLTLSFADGKVVCLLIHFYHPTMIHLDEILPTTHDSKRNKATLLENERSNSALASRCMSALGGLPAMIPISDTTNPPDEKSMLMGLSFLCARLMETSLEVRACVMIQNWYRDYHNRYILKLQLAAARIIWAGWLANKSAYYMARERKYGAAVLVIETFVSENFASLARLRLLRLSRERGIRAAIAVQKMARANSAKKRVSILMKQRESAIVLQCFWRQEMAFRKFLYLAQRHDAACRIQNVWRQCQLRDREKCAAATAIQKVFRGYWCRVQNLIDVLDIVAVQSCARRWLAIRHFEASQCAILQIQSAIHLFLTKARHIRHSKETKAVVKLQCLARRYKARKELTALRKRASNVIVLQRMWRRAMAEQFLKRLKEEKGRRLAATIIQCHWRRIQSLIVLEQRKIERQQLLAAVLVQSTWRMAQAQSLFQREKKERVRQSSATTIQSHLRCWLSRHELYRLRANAARTKVALNLQMCFRMASAKRELLVLKISADEKLAATRIQSTFRMFQAIILLGILKRRAVRNRAIVRLQSFLRGCRTRSKMQLLMHSAVCIQTSFRRSAQRQWFLELRKAALFIQSQWRRFSIARKYDLVLFDVRQCQSITRMFLAKKQCTRRRHALLLMQCFARQLFARRITASIRRERQLRQDSCILIQSLVRGRRARLQLHFVHQCATLIQAAFRRHVATLNYQFERSDITIVQSLVRRCLSKRAACRRQKSILTLQCWFRTCLAQVELDFLFEERERLVLEYYSAQEIQRMVRGFFGRKLILKEISARQIQKTWRCYTIHVDYMLSILAAVDIQAWVRRHLAMNAFDEAYLAIVSIQSFARLALHKFQANRERQSAIKIQSKARMMIARKRYLLFLIEVWGAAAIQATWRMAQARQQFLLKKLAATIIQSVARGRLVKAEVESRRVAAIQVQRMWRGYVGYDNYLWTKACIVGLQACVRRFLSQCRAHELRTERTILQHLRLRSTIKIQRQYRVFAERMQLFRAASIVQEAARCYLARIGFTKFRRGIARAQAMYRARQIRRRIPKALKVQAARIQKANLKAMQHPELKLGNRTKVALDILQNSRSLTKIMEAVSILEISTRLSRICCESFVHAGAFEILLNCICRCNRSLPHIKLMHGILLVLVNIARFEDLVDCLATPHAVKVFLDLIQMFRDKENIFGLVIFLLDEIMNHEVRKICQEFENLKRLKAVHKLCKSKLSISCNTEQQKNVRKLQKIIRRLE